MANAKRPARILVIDDEPSILSFADQVLRDAGYETVCASTGLQALRAAEDAGAFDLLLTDLVMPDLMGDEVARRLRQRWPELKVLYLTGYSERLFRQRTALWKDEAFLDKPTTIKGLLEAVSLLLSGHIGQDSNQRKSRTTTR
jgi:two-component system cell cycle sensor histidine kinase/response regulator CckA